MTKSRTLLTNIRTERPISEREINIVAEASNTLFGVLFKMSCELDYESLNNFVSITELINFLIIFVTTIYCATTWILVKPSRSIRMYFFLNICVAVLLQYTCRQIDVITPSKYDQYFDLSCSYFIQVYCFWIFIMCFGFYLVTVKERSYACSYKTSAIICWGLPLCSVSLNFMDFMYIKINYISIACALISAILYGIIIIMFLRIILKLVKSILFKNQDTNVYNRIEMYVFLGILFDCVLISVGFIELSCENMYVIIIMIQCLKLSAFKIICVWILASKTNRRLWKDYFRNRHNVNNNTGLNDASVRNETMLETSNERMALVTLNLNESRL